MSAPHLKPCPFCGGDGYLHESIRKIPFKGEEWWIFCACRTCGAHCGMGLGADRKGIAESAVAEWNRREPDWERKWSELVETTGRRIAESEKGKG